MIATLTTKPKHSVKALKMQEKQFFCVIILFSVIYLSHQELNQPCKLWSDCSGENEICKAGHCTCSDGAISWHGQNCYIPKKYGQDCKNQIECSTSGDPHLHCTPTHENTKRCLCSTSYDLAENEYGLLRCTKKEFKVNKMRPSSGGDELRTLSDQTISK